MKKYTILIYANGNSELEPEILQSKLKAEKSGSNHDVNVVLQISLIDWQFVNIFRFGSAIQNQDGYESGSKRYYVENDSSILLEDLQNANMADPKCLYDFIRWGMENYPAEHYIVILGGHAYQLVGMMPDYSQDQPYILGFPEMCKTFEMFQENTGKKIDLLILDTCYCNCVEVLYELGKSENPPIQNMLTYIGKGPLGGLPYDMLILQIQSYSNISDIDMLTHKLVDTLKHNLIAFKIDHRKLGAVKDLFNTVAYTYLSNSQGISMTPGELITNTSAEYPWCNQLIELHQSLQGSILHAKKEPGNKSAYINIQIPDLKEQSQLQRYSRLSFALDNAWTNLLSSKSLDYDFGFKTDVEMEPLPLSYEAVYTYISMMNPASNKEEWLSILKSLKKYKCW